jgi:hypothetical protein
VEEVAIESPLFISHDSNHNSSPNSSDYKDSLKKLLYTYKI